MSATGFPWPSKGDEAFAENRYGRVEAFLEGIEDFYTDYALADAFREVADAAIETGLHGETPPSPTRLLVPVLYLYRHSLELQMKSMLADAIRHGIVADSRKLTKAMSDHNLHKLWNWTRRAIEKLWPDEDHTPVNVSERVILELHRIDRSGQGFRYAYDKGGEHRHIDSIPKCVDLANLRQVLDGVLNFLGGAASRFDDMEHPF